MPLNFTKNQNLILEIFFKDPEKTYYLRELGRKIGKEPGVFQKDINKLVKDEILISEYRANSRFFKLNKNHHLYKEFKSIFLKTSGAQGKLEEAIKDIQKIKIAFIFGSYAKGKEDSFSDIDLMIIGNPDEDELILKISELERILEREINYHIFLAVDWIERIKKKDSFIGNIIAGPKLFLIGDKNELSRIS